MTVKDDLFQLIRSLSKTEKRYFKIEAGRHSTTNKNNHLRLFDVINEMDEYDEEKIK